jgi:hypothetical protein
MEQILLPSQIDLTKVKYGAVKVLPSGGKSIYLSHDNAPIMIQTPEMRSPFGLSKWDKAGEKGADGVEKENFKYDLLLGFDGKETRENLSTFFDKMVGFDDKLITDGMDNSMNWLGKKISSREVIEELYTPIVRYSRDKNTNEINNKYPPTFKVTVPFRNGKFDCSIYGPDKSELDLSTVNLQGARIVAIIQCVGIWVVNKKYGCSWKVLQMKVLPRSTIPKFAIREVENDKVPDEETENEEEVEEAEVIASSDGEDELDAKPKSGKKK